MIRCFQCACGLAVAVLALAAAAQEPASGWEESYSDSVPVSGGVIAGVLSGEPVANPLRGTRVWFRLPAAAEGRVCFEIVSSDGRYRAHRDEPAAGLGAGTHDFEFRSEHAAKFDDEETTFVPLVTLREDCAEAIQAVLLAGWHSQLPREQFTVFVNSGRLETRLEAVTEDGVKLLPDPCERLASGAAVAFDKQCTVKAAGVGAFDRLRIQRRRRFSRMPPVELPLSR